MAQGVDTTEEPRPETTNWALLTFTLVYFHSLWLTR